MNIKLEKLKEILIKDRNNRNSDDIKHLGPIISTINFFDSLKSHKPVLRECCMYLTYEFIPKHAFVFKEGEYGDKFYILIKGEASVIISVKENEKIITKEVLIYKDGSSFGELALTDKKPRAASIFTKTDCHFAILDKFNYNRILSSLLSSKREELIDFLKNQSCFKHLTKVSLLKLSYCFEEKLLKKNETLFKENDPLEYIYCIKEGEVKLSRKIKIEMIRTGEPVTKRTLFLKKHCWKKADIGILETGELLGVNDMENKVHSCTCVVNSNTAKILQATLHNFVKRVNNEETLNVINNGKALRSMLHQDSVNSVTKVLKERIYSPYKKLLFEEMFYTPKETEKVSNSKKKGRLLSANTPSRKSMDFDLSPSGGKFRTFEIPQRENEEFSGSRRRVKTALHKYRGGASNDEENNDRITRKKTRSVVVGDCELNLDESVRNDRVTRKKARQVVVGDTELNLAESVEYKNNIRKKNGFQFFVTKMNPFGKIKAVVRHSKVEEIINIHVKSKRSLVRPNTPKNWSFMNITTSVRRPISIDSNNRSP